MKPYFYKIQQISTGKFYVGCQYGKESDPSKFWVTYFTSCNIVKNSVKTDFKIILIKQRTDAKEYEQKYLSRMYKVLGREKFEQNFINRNLAPGILFTEEIRNKMSESIKRSVDKRKRDGTYVPAFSGKQHTDETKKILSENKKEFLKNPENHPRGMKGKSHAEDIKYKISQSVKNNSAMRGKCGAEHPTGETKWWNNGTNHVRSCECPGAGWVQGRIFKKRKKKIW